MVTPSEHVDVDAVPHAAFALENELESVDSAAHLHDKHQLLYAARGTLELECDGVLWLLPQARAAWLSAGTLHSVRTARASLKTVYFARPLAPATSWRCRVFDVLPVLREMILHSMQWGFAERADDDVAEPFFRALAAVASAAARNQDPYFLPAGKSAEVVRAMAYTRQRLSDELRISEVARAALVSPRTLARRFEAETAEPWSRYLHRARLLRAMELLCGDVQVSAAAVDVGFRSLGSFTAAFQRFTGETPTAYRRRMLIGSDRPTDLPRSSGRSRSR